MKCTGSILRHARVHTTRVGVNAPRHILHVLEPLPNQELCHLHGPHAMVAQHHRLFGGVQDLGDAWAPLLKPAAGKQAEGQTHRLLEGGELDPCGRMNRKEGG